MKDFNDHFVKCEPFRFEYLDWVKRCLNVSYIINIQITESTSFAGRIHRKMMVCQEGHVWTDKSDAETRGK